MASAEESVQRVEPPRVLLIGEPQLRQVCSLVEELSDQLSLNLNLLEAALDEFRRTHGFGRAISAPQIGVTQRFIACNLGHGTFFLINPIITWTSEEMFTMWDDCMSFPWLMVKVRRHRSITVQYVDINGVPQALRRVAIDISELLQHEIDHLDGVLALDRAVDANSIVAREVFERDKAHFEAQVDYIIEPTITPPNDDAFGTSSS
eukprot:TRINITY_DN32772_c0_g1_i1.p1 TRINITY_DN32772_c0_g1~~TRINITY_DN32772_c0_g1_i1.p1  ORF type:complete len:206 (+),score=20.01 TRINITY_DN32772_c0_g1_i1:754-1371(+)